MHNQHIRHIFKLKPASMAADSTCSYACCDSSVV